MNAGQVVLGVYLALGAALLVLLCMGIRKGTDWLKTRTHNEQISGLWARLNDIAQRVVNEVYQAFVDPLKRSGEWTDASAKEALDQALNKMRSYVGPQGLAFLEYLLGFGGAQTLDQFLTTFLENAVHTQKQTAPALPSATPAAQPSPVPLASPAT